MKSEKIRKSFEREIERAQTINELVWIGIDFKKNMSLSCDDLLSLCKAETAKRMRFEKEGQKYTRAMRPAWR